MENFSLIALRYRCQWATKRLGPRRLQNENDFYSEQFSLKEASCIIYNLYHTTEFIANAGGLIETVRVKFTM